MLPVLQSGLHFVCVLDRKSKFMCQAKIKYNVRRKLVGAVGSWEEQQGGPLNVFVLSFTTVRVPWPKTLQNIVKDVTSYLQKPRLQTIIEQDIEPVEFEAVPCGRSASRLGQQRQGHQRPDALPYHPLRRPPASYEGLPDLRQGPFAPCHVGNRSYEMGSSTRIWFMFQVMWCVCFATCFCCVRWIRIRYLWQKIPYLLGLRYYNNESKFSNIKICTPLKAKFWFYLNSYTNKTVFYVGLWVIYRLPVICCAVQK